MYLSDTICALATPPGLSGLAVIRLSGIDAFAIADSCFRSSAKLEDTPTHTIRYGKFYDGDTLVDTVTASVFVAPNSYTGENTVEFGCHGGMLVANHILAALISAGARAAEAGEFTKRAFLQGKLDLTQVESVADIIHASSTVGSQISARQLSGGFTRRLRSLREKLLDACALLELELDFSQEDLEFVSRQNLRALLVEAQTFSSSLLETHRGSEILRSGYNVGLVGYPNAGKSSLFNALLEKKRAIVSETPGTTRDFLDEHVMWNGISIHLFDTAGLRNTTDIIEMEGIELSRSLLQQCHLILVVNDVSLGINHSDELFSTLDAYYPGAEKVLVQNKADLLQNLDFTFILTSALSSAGLADLQTLIVGKAQSSLHNINDSLVNTRQSLLLSSITSSLSQANTTLDTGFSNEYVTIDIRKALSDIGRITGEIWDNDVLDSIFSRFCIGK